MLARAQETWKRTAGPATRGDAVALAPSALLLVASAVALAVAAASDPGRVPTVEEYGRATGWPPSSERVELEWRDPSPARVASLAAARACLAGAAAALCAAAAWRTVDGVNFSAVAIRNPRALRTTMRRARRVAASTEPDDDGAAACERRKRKRTRTRSRSREREGCAGAGGAGEARCTACRAPVALAGLACGCRYCDECLRVCTQCAQPVCARAHSSSNCVDCGAVFCCPSECVGCGAAACAICATVCAACGEETCRMCGVCCWRCGHTTCREELCEERHSEACGRPQPSPLSTLQAGAAPAPRPALCASS